MVLFVCLMVVVDFFVFIFCFWCCLVMLKFVGFCWIGVVVGRFLLGGMEIIMVRFSVLNLFLKIFCFGL